MARVARCGDRGACDGQSGSYFFGGSSNGMLRSYHAMLRANRAYFTSVVEDVEISW